MDKLLIVQSDFSMMLETSHPEFVTIRNDIIKFSEIQQAPEFIHIFKITDLSIWNAAAMGTTQEYILNTLEKYSQYEIPSNVLTQVKAWYVKYGAVELEYENYSSDRILLKATPEYTNEIETELKSLIIDKTNAGFIIENTQRGPVKNKLLQIGLPVKDNLGFTKGNPLNVNLKSTTQLRGYQKEAAENIHTSGHGTVILPCGSGKTIVGINLVTLTKTSTLIVTNSQTSVSQWKESLLKFTDISEDDIAIYGDNKEIKAITITTYNMVAYKNKNEFVHFNKFEKANFGLLICDEVHLMPADMFRIVASLQALKRLALTATFVREDGKEKEIFTLIGPKRYDKPWKDLEVLGFIAKIQLKEIRIPLNLVDKERYNQAVNGQIKFEISATAESKINMISQLIAKHKDDTILIIGHFTDNLEAIGKKLNIPVISGKTSAKERKFWFNKLRTKEINVLIASKIANAALDIPDINVVIQISFQYGSRNEEAQRIGRAIRPKEKEAFFYTLISKDTVEADYNFNRQKFLINEGYRYQISEAA